MSLVVTLTIAISGVYFATATKHGDDPSQQIIGTCQSAVKARLKAPTTARFTGTRYSSEHGQTADFYTVSGAVDAQNGFGAMIRSGYVCKLVAERDGTWNITDVSIT